MDTLATAWSKKHPSAALSAPSEPVSRRSLEALKLFANTDTRSHAGANAHSYPNTQSYPNTDAHPDADSHTHTHSGTHFLALGPHQFNSRGCSKRAGKPAAPR